jgi:hypothetical protein
VRPRERTNAWPIVIAAALLIPVGAIVWAGFAPRSERGSTAEPTGDAAPAIPTGWKEWAGVPLTPTHSTVWDGSELIAIAPGPEAEQRLHAMAFNPNTGTWRDLPNPPGPARWEAQTAWTGTEALFVGGTEHPAEGIAFDPEAGSWRELPPAPYPDVAFSVWTGSELFIWGVGDEETGGAMFHPVRGEWRAVAPAPIEINTGSAVWTGDEVIVLGSFLDSGNHARASSSIAAAYDPSGDRWQTLPTSDLSAQATSAVWVGDRLLAWDYLVRSQLLDPANDRWTDLSRMPLTAGECYPDSVITGDVVFAWYCGQAASFDVATREWSRLREGITEAELRGYKLWRFADLVPVGDAVFLPAEGLTFKDGGACYGCPGSPTTLWSYLPPSAASSPTG